MKDTDTTWTKVPGKSRIYRRGRVYRINFRDAAGIVRWKNGFRTVADAERARDEIDRLAGRGIRLSAQRVRMGAVCNAYLGEFWRTVEQDDRSAGTLTRYVEIVQVQIEPFFGRRLARNIDRFDVAEFGEHLRALGLAESTRALTLKVLSQVMDHAVGSGAHTYNPVIEYRRHQENAVADRLARTSGGVRILSSEERDRLLSCAPPGWRTAFAVLAHTGLTTGELLGLEWEDLDLDRRLVTVRRLRRPDGTREELRDARQREIPLVGPAVKTLTVWREAAHFRAASDPVFPSRNGGMRTRRSLDLAFRQSADRARLEVSLTARALRHAYAEMLIAEQVDCHELARRLGHASFESTFRAYGQLFEAAGRIEEAQQARRAVAPPRDAVGPDVDVAFSAPRLEPG